MYIFSFLFSFFSVSAFVYCVIYRNTKEDWMATKRFAHSEFASVTDDDDCVLMKSDSTRFRRHLLCENIYLSIDKLSHKEKERRRMHAKRNNVVWLRWWQNMMDMSFTFVSMQRIKAHTERHITIDDGEVKNAVKAKQ